MSKNRVSFSTYPQDYYTGCQAKVYIGSVWVDDLATIQYETSHSKTPLYGYCDHQFRSVAKGQFLVRGSFTIAFKETGYLYQIIKRWREDKTGLDVLKKFSPNVKSEGETFLTMLGEGYTIEKSLDQLKQTNDFEDAVEIMENAIWGKPGTPPAFKNRIPRSDELDYHVYLSNSSTEDDIDVEGFDILLTFGNYRAGNDTPEHTMISINDVHITGESMVVSPAAEPIGVTYQFFARGLNEKISNAWPTIDKETANSAAKDTKTEPEKVAEKQQKGIEDNKPTSVSVQNNVNTPTGNITKANPLNDELPILLRQPEVTPIINKPYVGDQTPLKASTPEQAVAYIEQLRKAQIAKEALELNKQSLPKASNKEVKKDDIKKEAIPTNLDKKTSFIVGPIHGNKDAVWSRVVTEAADYKGTILQAKLSLNGTVNGGSVTGKVSSKLMPWFDINANYKLYNDNTLVFTNVKCKLPISTLQSAMNSFFNSL